MAPLPRAGTLEWEPHMRLGPSPLGKNCCCCDCPPVCGLPTRGAGPNHAASLPPLPISPCLLLYVFICKRSFLLVFRLFSHSTDNRSVNSCDFGVCVGGGKLRVFLLCHRGQIYSQLMFLAVGFSSHLASPQGQESRSPSYPSYHQHLSQDPAQSPGPMYVC